MPRITYDLSITQAELLKSLVNNEIASQDAALESKGVLNDSEHAEINYNALCHELKGALVSSEKGVWVSPDRNISMSMPVFIAQQIEDGVLTDLAAVKAADAKEGGGIDAGLEHFFYEPLSVEAAVVNGALCGDDMDSFDGMAIDEMEWALVIHVAHEIINTPA